MSETERAGVCTCGRVVFSFDIELSILGVICVWYNKYSAAIPLIAFCASRSPRSSSNAVLVCGRSAKVPGERDVGGKTFCPLSEVPCAAVEGPISPPRRSLDEVFSTLLVFA